MPAVIPATTAAFSAISTFAASSSVAGFLVNTVSSIALSALATAIQDKPKISQPGITTETTTAGGTISQQLIFGRYATAGNMVAPMMVYQTDGNPNEWLVYVIALADLPVTGLNRIFVDGRALTIEGNPAAALHTDAMGATVLDTPQDSLRNKIYVRFHDGNQTAADSYLLRVFADYPERPWQADMIGRGVAYAVVTFKGKAQDNNYSGFPSIKFEVDGHHLLDPRTGQTAFTRNPAVIAYNILRGIDLPSGDRWGVGSRSFSDSHIIAAANLCDENVPVEGGGTRIRYQAGLEISLSDEPHQALMEIVKAMGGDVADMGGTWLLSAGEPDGPVLSITDDDIIVSDSRSLKPYPGLDETVNAIHASYPDPSQQWEAKEAVPLYNAEYEASDGGRRLIQEIDFPAVPYPRQVRALMREMLADHRRMRTHVITLPPDALGVQLGEHIAWSSVINGYVNKLFKVLALRVDPVSLCVAMTIVERDPDDYDYDAGSDGRIPTIPSVQPVAPVIVGVDGWVAEAVNAGGKPGIRMRWNPETSARAVAWEIRLGGVMVNSGTTANVGAGAVTQTAGLIGNTTYSVTGKLVVQGRVTESVTVNVTTLDIGIALAELDAEARELFDDFQDFINETPGLINDLRDEVEADIALIDGRVSAARTELLAEVASVEQLALDNLLVAQNYTDTSVQSESTARQTDVGQLAARIDQITAVSTSENILDNGDFSDGDTGWTGVTVAGGQGTVGAAGASQQHAETFAFGEMLQWRVEYSGPSVQVRATFMDGAGGRLAPDDIVNLPASATPKVGSRQVAPPDGTAQVRWRVVGEGAVIDNAVVTKIDQQVIARVQALEAALASDEQALALHKSEMTAEFADVDAAIAQEAATRAAADSAIASRTTTLEATTANHGSRITTTETALSDHANSISQLSTLVEADSGRRDLVRDGVWSRGNYYWPSGALPLRVVARDPASTNGRDNTVPATRYLNLWGSDAANTWRVSDFQPVTPNEMIEVSYSSSRSVASPVPAVGVRFFDASKTMIHQEMFPDTGSGVGWRVVSGSYRAPVGSVYARVIVGVRVAGTGTAGVTNVSALRTGAGYASSASVLALSQALSDDVQSLANYQIAVNSRFTNVEAQSQASANALKKTYTRAETSQAIAGRIKTFHTEVINPALDRKANASAVTALDTRVTTTEAGLAAQSSSITSINATVGRFSAGGLFRATVHATPTGANARVGLAATASAGAGAPATSGLYLDAVAGGQTRAMVVADLFAIATGPASAPVFPFIVRDNTVKLTNAYVDTLSIAGNAVTVPATGLSTTITNLDTVGTWIGQVSVGIARQGAPTLIFATFQIDGYSEGIVQFRVLRDGVVISPVYPSVTGSRGVQTSGVISYLDNNLDTGVSTYQLQASRLNSGPYNGRPRVVQRVMTILHVKR